MVRLPPVTERSEEMPVERSTCFDSLRGAPPHGQCVIGAVGIVIRYLCPVALRLCKFQLVVQCIHDIVGADAYIRPAVQYCVSCRFSANT